MRKMITVFFVLFCFVSCGKKSEEIETVIEDGVEVIINHLEPYKIEGENGMLFLEEESIIDFEREDLAEIGISEILRFDVDSDGNIYFRITGSPQDLIYKFDDKGLFLFSFGRRGQGPGELQSPKSLKINEKNQIEISDSARDKLYLFSKNGDFLSETSLPQRHLMATFLRNRKILAMKSIFDQEKGMIEFPIVLCSEDLEEIKILHPGRRFPNVSFAKKLNPLDYYFDYYTYSVSDELIYVGNYGGGYEFLIYDLEGYLLQKIRKDYKKIEVPTQIKEKVLDVAERNYFVDVLEKLDIPNYYPPFQFFFLDEDRRLYVMTYERGEDPNHFKYDIFNPNGQFIGRTELDNFGFSPSAINELPMPLHVVAKNDRIYVLREKENGFKELVVYRMKWE